MVPYVFQMFFCCHKDGEPRAHSWNTMAFFDAICRPDHFNPGSWPSSPDRDNTSGVVFWSIRACQSRDLLEAAPETEAPGFLLQRERGWIGLTNRSKGFHFQEWRSTTCLYARLDAEVTVGSVVSWFDAKDKTTIRYVPDNVDDPFMVRWRSKKIPQCSKDGGIYTRFCEKLAHAYLYWSSIWTRTLDRIDDLVSIKVSKTRY